MKSFNWFNDLSSILTQDLATAAVEETEPESMEFLANELGDKVEKLSQISWKEMFERYVPVVCDYLLRIALVLVIFFGGRKLIKKIVSLCDQALKRHGKTRFKFLEAVEHQLWFSRRTDCICFAECKHQPYLFHFGCRPA